jgi:hypothetical protein
MQQNHKRNQTMKTSIVRLSLVGFLAAVLAGLPNQSFAQTTNKVEKKTASATGSSTNNVKGGPFHGKLTAVDKLSKTIVVGKRTFQISSETKIKKSGKPATLEDGVVGDTVSGYIKPAPDGKLVATTVNFGPKPVTEGSDKQTPAPDKEKPAK